MKEIGYVIYAVYMCCTFWLLLTALLQFHLFWLSRKTTFKEPGVVGKFSPFVSIQVPVYNERYVIEDLLRCLASLDYPKDLFEIQVLDDSNDETSSIIDRVAAELRLRQTDISVVRRPTRTGYKAGALQYGLSACKGSFIAIFDADFRPSPDFLKRLLPHFSDNNVGLVQAKWGHQNIGQNFLTRIQSYLLDMHFKVEQAGRYQAGYFINFCGTAGIWRKQCITEAGGWDSNMLSEDLDISYRAQLKGWKMVFDQQVEVPAQLPAVMEAFRIQQFRWTKGIAQTARKMLASVKALPLPAGKKTHSYFQLLSSFTFVSIFINALLSVPLLLLRNWYPEFITLSEYTMIAALNLVALTFIYYQSAGKTSGSLKDFILHYPLFLIVYLAMSVQNSMAVLQGLSGMKSPFVRTPKTGRNAAAHAYVDKKIGWINYLEMSVLAYFLFAIYLSFHLDDYFLLPFFIMFAWGLIILIYQTLKPHFIERPLIARSLVHQLAREN